MDNSSQCWHNKEEFQKYFSAQLLQASIDQNKLAEAIIKAMPPKPTPWHRKLRYQIGDKWDDFRIRLSKKIYDWSSYEDDY